MSDYIDPPLLPDPPGCPPSGDPEGGDYEHTPANLPDYTGTEVDAPPETPEG